MNGSKFQIVEFFVSCGVLSAKMAGQASAFVSRILGEDPDPEIAVEIKNPKTGNQDWLFHRIETSAFLDWCFLVGLQNHDRVCRLFRTIAGQMANGIAKTVVHQRRLTGQNAAIGRNYYADAAQTLLCEVAYNSTEWRIIRLSSMELTELEIVTTRVSEIGILDSHNRERTKFLVNENIVVNNSARAKMAYHDFLRCENSWVAISNSGDMILPTKRERFIDENGNQKTRIVNIEPTFSYMRILYSLVANAFFPMELGPNATGFNELSAELADVKRSSHYRETETLTEFEIVAQSPEFSEQEKSISYSLELAVQSIDVLFHNLPAGLSAKNVLFNEWYRNFCGIVNSRPHKKHFSRMVKNFKKHCGKVFSTPHVNLDKPFHFPKPEKMTRGGGNVVLPKVERPIGRIPGCLFGSKWASSESVKLADGTTLDGWNFQESGFRTDFVQPNGDGI